MWLNSWEWRRAMKQWFAIGAAVLFFAMPAIVSAGEETVIPPEATWTPAPPASGLVAESATRVVSTEPVQASDIPRPVAAQPSRGPLALSAADAAYQLVNSRFHDE